jgi:hypothetical protein
MVSSLVQTLVDVVAVGVYSSILAWMWYQLHRSNPNFMTYYPGVSLLYFLQLLAQFLMFRFKHSTGPRDRVFFCFPCTEARLLKFGTINLMFSAIMIIVSIWDIIDWA